MLKTNTLIMTALALSVLAMPSEGNALEWFCSGLLCDPIPTEGGTIYWTEVLDGGLLGPVEVVGGGS